MLLDKYKEKNLPNSESFNEIPIKIIGYPNINKIIPLLKLECFSNNQPIHKKQVQQKKVYKIKNNFIVNPFEYGRLNKK